MVFAYPDLSLRDKTSPATFTGPVMSEVELDFLVSEPSAVGRLVDSCRAGTEWGGKKGRKKEKLN
jgi:hypothetical protein